jgi:hypothetical protein
MYLAAKCAYLLLAGRTRSNGGPGVRIHEPDVLRAGPALLDEEHVVLRRELHGLCSQ